MQTKRGSNICNTQIPQHKVQIAPGTLPGAKFGALTTTTAAKPAIEEAGVDGRIQRYHYDAAGHLTRHLNSGEVETEFERNALGQLQTKTSRRLDQGDVVEP